MDGEGAKVQSRPRGLSALRRSALVVPLAYGVYVALRGTAWALGEPGQDLSFYLVSTAIVLSPGVAYAAAGVLLFLGGRHRTAWFILLACGVVISALHLAAPLLLGVDFGGWFENARFVLEPMTVSLYLTVVAVVHVVRDGARRPAYH